ncbi:MAG: putative zinc-binding protein [Planctomycetaceae bacterium]|nr:putative zinc-binding protein [Planctomycetaceae bacterium]
MKTDEPIVLACAGCSFAGRLAYELAQELDRRGAAEMSCLAGVAADLPCFRKKLEDREVWIIDGCPLECSRAIFERNGRTADRHFRLHDYGIRKKGPMPEGTDLSGSTEGPADCWAICFRPRSELSLRGAVCSGSP